MKNNQPLRGVLYTGTKNGADCLKCLDDLISEHGRQMMLTLAVRKPVAERIGALVAEHFGAAVMVISITDLYKNIKKYEYIVIPMLSFRDIPLLLATPLLRIAVRCVIHNYKGFTAHKNKINRVVEWILLRLAMVSAQKIIFISDNVKNQFAADNLFKQHEHKFILKPYIRYYPVGRSASPPNRDIDFLIFGRNLIYKNAQNTYNALKELEDEGERFSAWFVGDGYTCPQTKNITIVDAWVTDDDACAYHRRAKCCVLFYTDVSQSGPAMLGLSLGCDLIAADLPFFAFLKSRHAHVYLCDNANFKSTLRDYLKKNLTPSAIKVGQKNGK